MEGRAFLDEDSGEWFGEDHGVGLAFQRTKHQWLDIHWLEPDIRPGFTKKFLQEKPARAICGSKGNRPSNKVIGKSRIGICRENLPLAPACDRKKPNRGSTFLRTGKPFQVAYPKRAVAGKKQGLERYGSIPLLKTEIERIGNRIQR